MKHWKLVTKAMPSSTLILTEPYRTKVKSLLKVRLRFRSAISPAALNFSKPGSSNRPNIGLRGKATKTAQVHNIRVFLFSPDVHEKIDK